MKAAYIHMTIVQGHDKMYATISTSTSPFLCYARGPVTTVVFPGTRRAAGLRSFLQDAHESRVFHSTRGLVAMTSA